MILEFWDLLEGHSELKSWSNKRKTSLNRKTLRLRTCAEIIQSLMFNSHGIRPGSFILEFHRKSKYKLGQLLHMQYRPVTTQPARAPKYDTVPSCMPPTPSLNPVLDSVKNT